ncbi:hypothetical protein B0I37DRAFT_363806 [Chaetomium sp. MPI-CAGE-AT-0009]|nr:hypothetical protein B0I37DRAFT_363806 [Chaetomium sp. MPI-CAGE-AT-0009]
MWWWKVVELLALIRQKPACIASCLAPMPPSPKPHLYHPDNELRRHQVFCDCTETLNSIRMDPFSIPITPVTPPHVEVDSSLLTITDSNTIDVPVPEVRALTEERFNNFNLDDVTHVVIEITYSRQTQIFRSIGYQYDWNLPAPFWNFLGRIAAKGVFDDRVELENLNFCAVGRREFVAYTTSAWTAAVEARKAAGEAERPPLNATEVKFKKPQPGQPIEMTWAPARALITTSVARMKHCDDHSDEPAD